MSTVRTEKSMGSRTGGEPHTAHGPFELTAAQMRVLLGLHRRPERTESARQHDEIAAPAKPPPQPPQPPGPPPKPASQTPTAAISWQATGLSGATSGAPPPDTQIAASDSHVIVTANQQFAIYLKDGTKVGKSIDFISFFKPLNLNDGTVNGSEVQSDPRLIFDAYRRRFWLIHGAGNGRWLAKCPKPDPNAPNPDPSAVRGRIYVAVSKSADATGGWWYYWWDAVANWGKKNDPVYKPGDGADYPSIGIDSVCFHQTIPVGSMDPSKADCVGPQRYSYVVIRSADDMANGKNSSWGWQFYDLTDPNGKTFLNVIQPVVHHDLTNRSFYVASFPPDKLRIWAVSNLLTKQPKVDAVTVMLTDAQGKSEPFAEPLLAPQKGAPTTIDMQNLNNDVLKGVYRNGLLYLVLNDAKNWFNDKEGALSSIRLVRLSVSNFPKVPTNGDPSYINRVFGMNNIVDDNPEVDHMHYGWPAIEVTKSGVMVIVYARSGKTIYPEVRVSAYYPNEPDIRPSRLLKKGDALYGNPSCVDESGKPCVNRWGDTAGASVDPAADTNDVWVAQQYSAANGDYGIWVGKFSA